MRFRDTSPRSSDQPQRRHRHHSARLIVSDPGSYELRLLPLPGARRRFHLRFGVHYHVGRFATGPNASSSVRCRRKTLREPCYLCEAVADVRHVFLHSYADLDGQTLYNAMRCRARDRYVANVIDVVRPDQGVRVLEFSKAVFVLIKVHAAEIPDLVHPERGLALRFTYGRQAHPALGSLLVCQSVEPVPRPGPIPLPDWRDRLHDLNRYARRGLLTNAELAAMFRLADQNEGGDEPWD